jgi:xylulose-5-phosphate/fructose-6-phosphate phosphoketolase
MVANTYLEGTYSEIYPNIAQMKRACKRLFRQFSFPGGIPSHAAPETPGSIHEGGELGYALVHAYGAVFDNPDLLACCVVGDGEAETGPLRRQLAFEQVPEPGARWRGAAHPSSERLQDRRPTVLARIPHDELAKSLFEGYGYKCVFRRRRRSRCDAPA